MKRHHSRFCCSLAAVLTIASAFADVSLPAIFGSHMVLQRGEVVPVWGFSEPNEKVAVEIGGQIRKTVADAAGKWRVDMPAMAPGTGHTMVIKGFNTLTLEDVAVGEVWLCSGQSNMEMGIQMCLNPAAEIAAANYPDIRLIDVPKVTLPLPKADFVGSWVRCSPETVVSHGTWGGFSAAAYYFGRTLHQELKVPIGLIDSSWGGSRIEPWIPPVGFDAVPALAETAKQVALADPRTDLHKATLVAALGVTEQWMAQTRAGLATNQPVSPIPPWPASLGPRSGRGDPCAMYNAMIHPLVPYGIRGAIWYQGESNHHDRMAYVDKTQAQVEGWRKLWNKPELPYYFTQIAPYQYGSENPEILATFWEAQATIEKKIPHTGMAVIHDVGNLKDIHPKNKQQVGRRLALLALAETYGRRDIVCRGPLYASCDLAGGQAVIHFENAAGLKTTDGKAPTRFQLGGDNGRFVDAVAKIEGETVVLSHPEITQATAVRFAWHKLAEPNLMNGADLPATAFRFGEIPRDALVRRIAPETKDYTVVYDLKLPNINVKGDRVVYDVDESKALKGDFDRVGYLLYLRLKNGEERYVFASMDAFVKDLDKIGVPAFATKAQFQQAPANLTVSSNVPGIKTGPIAHGWLEFWACNYGPANAAKVPGASAGKYDFGDQTSPETPRGYGSMQIHNVDAKQVILAYNNWNARGSCDIGIGNSPKGQPDYTFEKNGSSYAEAKLTVLVRPVK
ncbi:MAG: 9-O-acetylesterase [Victivallales bacterium]|nr:9-O-acetylesterase [Victivallales bacterium]